MAQRNGRVVSGSLGATLSFKSTSGSHVVCHIDGIQLVGQEGVAQVHALLLAPRVDRDDAGVHDDHHTNDEVMLFQNHISDEGNQIKSFLLRPTELHHDHQKIGPREDSAVRWSIQPNQRREL